MKVDWHSDTLNRDTPVDSTFRKTQNVRRTLIEMCGPAFRFDHDMITFVEEKQPETLGAIADYWLARQGKGKVI
ncbi:MAG: hypothetical protein GW905_10230 [Rhodobacterales bacterium]|nr:hypothetical protein [Rhodobacterales bacterium]